MNCFEIIFKFQLKISFCASKSIHIYVKNALGSPQNGFKIEFDFFRARLSTMTVEDPDTMADALRRIGAEAAADVPLGSRMFLYKNMTKLLRNQW